MDNNEFENKKYEIKTWDDDFEDNFPPDNMTLEEELLEKARIVLQSNLSTGFSDAQKPSEKEMADLINEAYEKGVTNYEEFSRFAGSTRFSHKNIVTSAEKILDNDPFFFLAPYLETKDIEKIKNKTFKNLIETLSNYYGIVSPPILALSPYKLYGNRTNMSMGFDGEFGIYVKPALLNKKQQNYGFSFPEFITGIFHELEHRKQFTFIDKFFNGEQNMPSKYKFLAQMNFMESCLILAHRHELIDASYLESFSYYFASLWEIDARVTAAKETLNLIKNPHINSNIKKQLYKNLFSLMHATFDTGFNKKQKVYLLRDMLRYTQKIIKDFNLVFGDIEFAKNMLVDMPKDGPLSLIKEAHDVRNDIIQMHKIYIKNNVLNLKHQITNVKDEITKTIKDANEILHKTPILAKETLKAAKNLPANTLYRLAIITGNIRYIAKNIYKNRKKIWKKNTYMDKEMEK